MGAGRGVCWRGRHLSGDALDTGDACCTHLQPYLGTRPPTLTPGVGQAPPRQGGPQEHAIPLTTSLQHCLASQQLCPAQQHALHMRSPLKLQHISTYWLYAASAHASQNAPAHRCAQRLKKHHTHIHYPLHTHTPFAHTHTATTHTSHTHAALCCRLLTPLHLS